MEATQTSRLIRYFSEKELADLRTEGSQAHFLDTQLSTLDKEDLLIIVGLMFKERRLARDLHETTFGSQPKYSSRNG